MAIHSLKFLAWTEFLSPRSPKSHAIQFHLHNILIINFVNFLPLFLFQLSLRDNPLVVQFVQDMALNPPSLLELSARVLKASETRVTAEDIPHTLVDYLSNANCCVNPKCKGVFFDSHVEHIKFVDFCGKYRVPLMQYLCSSK